MKPNYLGFVRCTFYFLDELEMIKSILQVITMNWMKIHKNHLFLLDDLTWHVVGHSLFHNNIPFVAWFILSWISDWRNFRWCPASTINLQQFAIKTFTKAFSVYARWFSAQKFWYRMLSITIFKSWITFLYLNLK